VSFGSLYSLTKLLKMVLSPGRHSWYADLI